jgi:hypothetical protein
MQAFHRELVHWKYYFFLTKTSRSIYFQTLANNYEQRGKRITFKINF